MFKIIKKHYKTILSFLSGALLTYAFAPFYQGWLAFLSPILLLHTTEKQKPKQAFKHGFLFGCGFFGFGVYWIFHSIFHYGQTTATLAYLITGAFIGILALFPALMMALTQRSFRETPIQRAVLAFPVIWVVFEILRGSFLTGFPWLFLGTSQISNSTFAAFAPVGSVWLISWMVMICAGTLYSIIVFISEHHESKKTLYLLIALFVSIWVSGGILDRIQWTKPEKVALDVALLQGNIPQRMRWAPEHIAEIMNTYEDLTKQAVEKADVVIWPEGAVPLPMPYSKQYFAGIDEMALANQTAVLVGVPEKAPHEEVYYNALMGLGEATGFYYKERLVPFGEFVPFEKYLRGIIGFFDLPMSSFVAREDKQFEPLTIFGLNTSAAICYEIAYPTLIQKSSRDADFLVTVSNDTWFGKSIGPQQHLEIAAWRAIETGRYVLRATNTGFTAIIAPNGEADVAPQFETTILYGKVPPVRGNTPWVQYGIWPLLSALLLTLAVCYRKVFPIWLQRAHALLQKTKKKLKPSTSNTAARKGRNRRRRG